jgi:hypothetical protein
MGLSWLALLTPVWYTGTVREEDGMKKCVGCGVFMEKMEVFPKGVCLKCYAVEFEKEFQSALKVARLK